MHSGIRIGLGALFVFLSATAMAQDGPVVPPEVQAIFPPSEDYCYAAHIAAKDMKPKQKLTDFYLYRLFNPDPALEEIELTREEESRTAVMREKLELEKHLEGVREQLASLQQSARAFQERLSAAEADKERLLSDKTEVHQATPITSVRQLNALNLSSYALRSWPYAVAWLWPRRFTSTIAIKLLSP